MNLWKRDVEGGRKRRWSTDCIDTYTEGRARNMEDESYSAFDFIASPGKNARRLECKREASMLYNVNNTYNYIL